MDSVLTISLVILVLPLVAFVIQLWLGKMKTPLDYVVDPHENAHHDHDVHGNVADAHTSDHTQHAVDVPHKGGHDPHDIDAHAGHAHMPASDAAATHAAHDHHYAYHVTERRGPWTNGDQKRAYSLAWVATAIMGVCLALAIYVAYTTISAPSAANAPNWTPKTEASTTWYDFGDKAT